MTAFKVARPVARAVASSVVVQDAAGEGFTNPTASYSMTETSDGSVAVTRADSSSNEYDLTDNGTVTNATGPTGDNAAAFTLANGEYFSLPYASAVNLCPLMGDFTLEFWAYVTDTMGFNAELISSGIFNDANVGGFNIRSRYSTGNVNIGVGDTDGNTGGNSTITAGQSDIRNQWVHNIWKVNRSSNRMFYKINNVDKPIQFGGDNISSIGSIELGSSRFLNIGGTGANVATMDGRIGPVRFWVGYLTTDVEDTFLYNSGNGRLHSEIANYSP